MKKLITFASQKGGVGKTTDACFAAIAFASRGFRVCAIDSDANNNMTDYFEGNETTEAIERHSIYRFYKGDVFDLAQCTMKTAFANLHCIPTTPKLAQIGADLNGDPSILMAFEEAARGLDYDIVIIDSPPSRVLEFNIPVYGSDLICIPVSFDKWKVDAIESTTKLIAHITRTKKVKPEIIAVPSMVTPANDELLRMDTALALTKTSIFKNDIIARAVSEGKIIKTNSVAFTQYLSLSKELYCEE
jgi:chromosome partitioning protein